jgi:HD-like signal output (HDOD) protein
MDADTALAQFESIFNSDPSLAAEVLRLANSVEFGLRAKVTNIRFALVLLGIERTRGLAFSILMSRYPQKGLRKAETRSFWMHSIATGMIAEELGRALHTHTPMAYTAGLTHDLGRLGLVLAEHDAYLDYLSKQFQNAEEAHHLERLRFGFTHGEAGAYLTQTWQFPPMLCRAIRMHHEVLEPDEEELVRITQAACGIATEMGFPELPNCPPAPSDSPLAEHWRKRYAECPEQMVKAIEHRVSMF